MIPLTRCPSLSHPVEADLTLNLCKAYGMQALQEGTLKKVAESMTPGFPDRNISQATAYLHSHSLTFTPAQQV